jgi:hypothetical protein
MLEAVNSKRRRYDPVKYMMNGRELRREAREAAERSALTGDQVLEKLKRLGARIIDNRKVANSGINQR